MGVPLVVRGRRGSFVRLEGLLRVGVLTFRPRGLAVVLGLRCAALAGVFVVRLRLAAVTLRVRCVMKTKE